MKKPDTSSSSQWLNDMQTLTRDLQNETILFTLPALGLGGILVLSLVIWTNNPVWEMIIAGGLFLLAGVVWRIYRASFLRASILIIAGTWTAVLLTAILYRSETILFLWIISVGLATMLLGEKVGVFVVLGSAVCLLIPLPFLGFISSAVKSVTVLGMVAALGMIYLTLRPLLTAVHWSWASYRSSQESLQQARTFQTQLQQTLQDITFINNQLKLQNKLTQSLRLEAETERRAKQEFVANVSHELRTPLNMIIGFSRTMLDNPETYGEHIPSKLLADLQVILRNSQHLSSLIDDVLDISQIDANRMALTKERVDLSVIIEAAVTAVRPLFESKSLFLEVDLIPDLPQLWCDRTRIREVLLNLLSNAGRFTETGGVRVQAHQTNASIIVSVTDTGLGIAEADRSKLFQPFQQVDGSIRRKYGGTGLGLSISKAFVELHDGEMWVDSVEGQGTTFYFKLPVDPILPLPPTAARWFNPYKSYEETPHVTEMPTPEVHSRILVVEKSNVLQRMLSRYFHETEIIPMTSLEAAVAEASAHGAQALLVNDVRFHETADRLKDVDSLPFGIPALVCSMPGTEQAIEELGVANYLVKPISREALLEAIASLGKPIETILVVDDEPDARQLFRRMLTGAQTDYRVLRAGNGNQALEVIQREAVDLIFLDLTMPGMDGFAFLEARESFPGLRDIPVILISARDPQGQPIASNILAVARGGGLSAHQVMACIEAFSKILAPGKTAI